MASNVGGDNSQDFRNSDNSKSFKVTGGYSSTVRVRRKLACKFGDTVRENFEAEVERLSGLASSCRAGENTGLKGAVENDQPQVTVSSQSFPDHNEFVPQDLDEGNLESVESIDSLKAHRQEERLLYEAKIADLEREKEEEAKNFKQKLCKEEKEKNAFRKRCQQLEASNDKLASELKEIKSKLEAMNDKLASELKKKNKEVSDLEEELADLMRHLDTQQAIANKPDETRQELQDGKVFLAKGPSPGPRHPKKTGRRKGRRK